MRLILPVSGRSTRFSGLRPKWLLTHPSGDLMLAESIKGLELEKFEEIVVICLKSHVENYEAEDVLKRQFEKMELQQKLRVVIIDESESQPHTVYQGLLAAGIKGKIFIKDSDNYFKCPAVEGNVVSYVSIANLKKVNAANKSYVFINENGIVNNIVEKQVISETFCAGGYGFESAEEFAEQYEKMKDIPDLYISHIIYKMVADGSVFRSQEAFDFLDWGTIEDWNAYRRRFCTLFVDLDGTLVKNSAQFFSPHWGETDMIAENVNLINSLYSSGYAQIIIITARSQDFASATEKQLKKIGIKYHQIIYGLLHAKRIVVNDYSKSNPYKSCEAINLQRDSAELKDMLSESINMEV